MKELILHIGCGKTGSSALQSWLANNQQNFANLGICYAGDNEKALEHKINSGNAKPLIRYLENPKAENAQEVFDFYFEDYDKAIISGEGMQRMLEPELEKLEAFIGEFGISVVVVAFVRNIYDHCYSGYVQGVKKFGRLESFNQVVTSYKKLLSFDVVNRYFELFEMQIIHYERAKEDVAQAFCTAVDFDYQKLEPIAKKSVNRTLSQEEIAVLQQLIEWLQASGFKTEGLAKKVSHYLIDNFPDLEVGAVYDESVIAYLKETFSKDLEVFNKNIASQYGFELSFLTEGREYEEKRDENKEFDATVLSRLVEFLCGSRENLGVELLKCCAEKMEGVGVDQEYVQRLEKAAEITWLDRIKRIVRIGRQIKRKLCRLARR